MADSKVQNNNYVVVQGWMVSRLGLKGGELLTYAIIYGFSQAEDQGYTGTIQYLADWTSSSPQSVRNWLKSLCIKGLITRREYTVNNVCFVEYTSNILRGEVKNFEGGGQKNITEGVKNFDPDNTNDKIEYKIEDKERARGRAHALEKERADDHVEREGGSEPTLDEIKAYINEHKLKVDAVTFVKHYESLGVHLGGAKLKSWKARLELWDRRARLGDEDKKKDGGSFDTEDFFEAAVNKSYGKSETSKNKHKDDDEVIENLKGAFINA